MPEQASAGESSSDQSPDPEESMTTSQSAIIQQSTLDDYLDAIHQIVDEAKLHFEDGGFRVVAVDPANVGMTDALLTVDGFESYDFAPGGTIGIDIGRLRDMIGIGDGEDLVELELDEETRKLHIQIDGFEGTMALIDPDSIRQEPDLPDLDLPANIVLEGSDVNRAVKAADMVSDHIALGVDESEPVFYVDAEGDTDDVHFELGRDDLIDLTAEPAHSLFSLDYLKDMNKAIPSDTEVEIDLGEEFPFDMGFQLGESAIEVRYMLAPRIQSE